MVKAVLLIGNEAMVLGSRARNEIFNDSDLKVFALLARNVEIMKTPRGSFLAAYDCCWRTRRPCTPHQEHASKLLALVTCEEL